jgi:heme/copper-type cytochrome/quinol oxidase subunit 2
VAGARRQGLLAGPASALCILLMLAGCLFLWVGVPLAWLWIGSQVQGSHSLGTALMVMMTGVIVTVVITVAGLSWLNRLHARLREARGIPPSERSPLEVIFVASAAIAVVCFVVWFFVLAGTSPIPVEVGF